MNVKRISASLLVLALGLMSSACFSFEQEIFLNPDGSGELALYFSIPDLPDELMKSGAELGKKNPADEMADLKRELTAGAPRNLKVREVREIRQNGARGVLAIFEFKDLKDVAAALSSVGNGTLKDSEVKGKNEWSVRVEKVGAKKIFNARFLLDLDDRQQKPKAGVGKGEGEGPDMKGLEEQLKSLFLGMIKMRFVLHTPAPITSSNADVVYKGNIAVWNSSPAAFFKNKRPIEMKATY